MNTLVTACLSLAIITLQARFARADEGDLDAASEQKRLAALLAKHAHEPRVEDVVRAALASSTDAPDRFDSMMRRARLRGLVPSLEVGARRGQGVDLRSASESAAEGIHLTTADDLTLMASLRFELGRLLFASEEISIARERRSERSQRAEVARTVVALYFQRKRLVLERELGGHNNIDHEVRIAEAEALLDAFTNGAFRRMMASSSAWTTGANSSVTRRP